MFVCSHLLHIYAMQTWQWGRGCSSCFFSPVVFVCFNRVGWWWLIFELGRWWLIYVTWGLGAIISARPKVSPSSPLQHAQHDQDLCSTSIKHLAIEEYGKMAAAFVVILTQFCNNSLFCTPWGHSNIKWIKGKY